MVLTVLPERLKADVTGGLARRLLLIIVALGRFGPRLGVLARFDSPVGSIDSLSKGQLFVDFFDTLSIGLIFVHKVAEAEPAHSLVLRICVLLKNTGGSSGHRLETRAGARTRLMRNANIALPFQLLIQSHILVCRHS